MKRIASFSTLVIGTLGALGCASTEKSREPANTVISAAVTSDLMTQHFAEASATQAVLTFGPGGRPACQVELYDHPEMTPRYLTSSATRRTVPLALPRCATPEQNRIFEIVMGRDPATEAPTCAWNDAWSAANARVLHHRHHRHRRRHAPAVVAAYRVLECRPARAGEDAAVTYLVGPAHEAGRHL